MPYPTHGSASEIKSLDFVYEYFNMLFVLFCSNKGKKVKVCLIFAVAHHDRILVKITLINGFRKKKTLVSHYVHCNYFTVLLLYIVWNFLEICTAVLKLAVTLAV